MPPKIQRHIGERTGAAATKRANRPDPQRGQTNRRPRRAATTKAGEDNAEPKTIHSKGAPQHKLTNTRWNCPLRFVELYGFPGGNGHAAATGTREERRSKTKESAQNKQTIMRLNLQKLQAVAKRLRRLHCAKQCVRVSPGLSIPLQKAD